MKSAIEDRFEYTIPEDSDDSRFLHFEVRDSESGEAIVSFYTNGVRCGMFARRGAAMEQTRGTGQFSMPSTASKCKAKLRKMAERALGWC